MRQPLAWDGGVNLNADPKAIRDNQLALAKNVMPTLEGLLDKREPVLAVREAVVMASTLPPAFIKPITLSTPDPVTGFPFVLHYQDDVLGYERLLASTFDKHNYPSTGAVTGAVVSVRPNASGNQPYGPYVFVNYRGRVLAIGGENEGFYQLCFSAGAWTWVKASFAWVASAGGGAPEAQTQSIDVQPRRACSYRGRMVYANFGPGMGNWMVMADRDSDTHTNVTDKPLWAVIGDDVLAENGRHMVINAIQGENIIAMAEVSLMAVGSQIQTALLLLTERSAVLCTGEPVQTFESQFDSASGYIGDFQANKVNYEVGSVGQSALCTTPYGTCWASKDEVWMLQGNTPVKVGTNIAPAMRACPPSMRQWWSMAYANGVLFLSLVTQNTTDAYLLATQHWRLDLRQGLPQNAADAKWWGPQDYEGLVTLGEPEGTGALCHSLVTRRDEDERDVVYSMIRTSHTTTNAPYTYAQNLMLVSFNQGEGGLDIPYQTVLTGRTWAPSDEVPLGDVVRPTAGRLNGRLYKCVVSGVTGVGEPTWNVAGAQFADGTVEWREVPYASVPGYRLINWEALNADGSILMSVKFKDSHFGEPSRNKVVRWADLVAKVTTKARIDMPVITNGGNIVGRLGPAVFGGTPAKKKKPAEIEGQDGAANELGSLRLDTDFLAAEYEARALRPRHTESHAEGIQEAFTAPGVVKGRQLQPTIRDGSGYVIDDTNNKLCFGDWENLIEGAVVYQATITKGYYSTLNQLMNTIKTSLNAVNALILGVNGGWNYESVVAAEHPYMTTITKTIDGARDDTRAGFFFGLQDATALGVNYYLTRSLRLLAMLGFNTGPDYAVAAGFLATLGGVQLGVIGETLSPLATAPTIKFYGEQVIPYKTGAVVSVSSCELEVHLKAGLPFGSKSR